MRTIIVTLNISANCFEALLQKVNGCSHAFLFGLNVLLNWPDKKPKRKCGKHS